MQHITNKLTKYSGKNHAQGGVNINPNVEVEKGEVKHDDYVISNRLPNKNKSFAKLAEKIAKKYKKGNKALTSVQLMSMENELNDLKKRNEMFKMNNIGYSQQNQTKQFALGGDINDNNDPLQTLPIQPLDNNISPLKSPYTAPTDNLNVTPDFSSDYIHDDKDTLFSLPITPVQNDDEFKDYYLDNRLDNTINNIQSQAQSNSKPSFFNKIGQGLNKVSNFITDENNVMKASLSPMIASSLNDLVRPSEQAKLFQNPEYYNSLDLMRENRVNFDAITNNMNRQADAARNRMTSRSAQVNNALNTNIDVNLNQQMQQAKFQEQSQNNQLRAQEAQMRSNLGMQDRQYKHQQYLEQSQNDAQKRNMGRAAAQNLWNTVGKNINAKQVREAAQKNQKQIAALSTMEKINYVNSLSSTFGISEDYSKAMLNYIFKGDDKAFAELINNLSKNNTLKVK
tara:strand:- start:1632 stop:2993 length:1362 start_codon:yes stop_codon:yes gene_type:complete